MNLLMNLGTIGGGLLFWVSLLFPIITGIVWPWWKSWWGRNIASLEFALMLVLFPSVLHREFGLPTDTYSFEWVAIIALFAASAIVVWRGIMVFKTQFEAHRKGDGNV